MRTWLLPEHIDDLLPPEAEAVESVRRTLLDHFALHGYHLVRPPLLEHVDALLIGSGRELDLYTFKVVDQLSGRLLGLRADITPQVARIDAHVLNREGVTRLCYAGSVLHTRPMGLIQNREVLQVGAELYGFAGIAADKEVLRLMLSSLTAVGVRQLHLALGHVGIYRALLRLAKVPEPLAADLFAAMRAKDVPELTVLVDSLSPAAGRWLVDLSGLHGAAGDVLHRAPKCLPRDPEIARALDDLARLVEAVRFAEVDVQIDLSELRGLDYHNGVVFSAYVPGQADAIARGGRYDNIGAAFGRERAATGFSVFPRQLAEILPRTMPRPAILAPDLEDPELAAAITGLRRAGEVVIVAIEGNGATPQRHGCDRRLVRHEGRWTVEAWSDTQGKS